MSRAALDTRPLYTGGSAVLDAYRIIARRASGVPDRTADNATVKHAARLLRGQR